MPAGRKAAVGRMVAVAVAAGHTAEAEQAVAAAVAAGHTAVALVGRTVAALAGSAGYSVPEEYSVAGIGPCAEHIA